MSTYTEKMIEVMQAQVRGEKIQRRFIRYRESENPRDDWEDVNAPAWNWEQVEYRVKPKEPEEFWRVMIPVRATVPFPGAQVEIQYQTRYCATEQEAKAQPDIRYPGIEGVDGPLKTIIQHFREVLP